jgi:hypothetical protein
VLGTVLSPVWFITDYRYEAVAFFAFLVLVLLIAVLLWVQVNARSDSQRIFVIAWFLSPAGAYLFHEVGYADQVVYLLLGIAIWAVNQQRMFMAVVVMSISVLVHELTLFTTLPLLALWIALTSSSLRQLAALAIPGAVGLSLALAPGMSDAQVASTNARLTAALPYEIRPDAITLFGRSLRETWALEFYRPWEGFAKVLPLLLVCLLATIVLSWSLGFLVRDHRNWLPVLLAVAALSTPFLLVFFGWDFDRWMFLGLSNFLVVGLLLFQFSPKVPGVADLGVVLIPILLLFHLPITYFDGESPRPLSRDSIERVFLSPQSELFRMPDDRL